MKNLFELPELLTISGTAFTGDASTDATPNSCDNGCDKGCHGGGCFPGSAQEEN